MKLESKKVVPDGWKMVALGDVTQIVNGTTPKSSVSEFWGGDIVWITPTDLGKLQQKEIVNSDRTITHDGFNSCGLTVVPVGTVILSSRAPIGHLGIAKTDLCINQGCKALVPGEIIDSVFLYYVLKQSVPQLQELGNGATFAEVSKSQVEKFEIPLPPLPEQKRIAAILTERLAAVERARKASEARLEAARALPAAYLREVFESDEIKGSKAVPLGTICTFVGGMQPPKSTFVYEPREGYVRLVQIQDFRKDDVAVYIHKSEARRIFSSDDVMIGRYGPPVFQILRGLEGAYNVALMKAEPKPGLDKNYLYYLLQEEGIQRAVIEQSQRAAGQSGVQKTFLENYKVRVPNLDVQRNIARRLYQKSQLFGTLARNIFEAHGALSNINSALLRQAFSGAF